MKPFIIMDAEQRSPEWFQARLGRVTGSKAAIVLMGEKTAGYADYAMQLALERMTGLPEPECYVSKDMQRGIDKEQDAREAIEVRDGSIIQQSGFLAHKDLMIGISLDGHEGDFSRTFEFKCPKSKTHVAYLQEKRLPPAYRAQVMHGLLITGASDNTFASFDDRMPEGLELFTIDSKAKDLPIEEYSKALAKFLNAASNMEAQLRLMQRGKL